MFRTSNLRGQKRFLEIRASKKSANAKLQLTKAQLKLIEDCQILTIGEKIELLQLALGDKLTTEIYLKVKYRWSEKQKKELPNQRQLAEIKKLLEKLPFKFYQDHLPKKSKLNGRLQDFTWFQVSVNQRVADFMRNYPDDLTEFEEGVLYGFPSTATRAFSGLIEASKIQPETIWSYYLGGVFSKSYFKQEDEYYKKIWQKLKKISPKIIAQAEREYKNTS